VDMADRQGEINSKGEIVSLLHRQLSSKSTRTGLPQAVTKSLKL